MKRELQEKMFGKYPEIFAQRKMSMSETSMCWGIECGDGWYWLIDKLCEYLQLNTGRNSCEQIEAVQVKEKYGTLRFYTNCCDDRQESAINFAEFLSGFICEKCGSTNNVSQTTGWVATLCQGCMSEYKNRAKDSTK